jgi:hypothetical protein
VPVAKAVTGRSQLITTGISMLSPGSSRQRTARAALAGSWSALARSLLLSGMEPSVAKGCQSSAPSPAGFQRLQRWIVSPGWRVSRLASVAMHHWPCPSASGVLRSPSSSTPLRLAASTQRLRWPRLRPIAGT